MVTSPSCGVSADIAPAGSALYTPVNLATASFVSLGVASKVFLSNCPAFMASIVLCDASANGSLTPNFSSLLNSDLKMYRHLHTYYDIFV